jgi:hypothetical protein
VKTSNPGGQLAEHEVRFLAALDRHFSGLPLGLRRSLHTTARQHLVDRPTTDDFDTLQRELGTPEDYARLLMDGEGTTAEVAMAKARSVAATPPPVRPSHKMPGTRRNVTIAVGVALVVVVVATVGFVIARQRQAPGAIQVVGWRVAYVGTDDRAGITHSEAGSVSQDTVDFKPGGAATLEVQVVGDSDVTLLDANMGVEAPGSMAHLVNVEVTPGSDEVEREYRPLREAPLAEGGRWVRFTFRFAHCETNARGSTNWWNQMTVLVRVHGRTQRMHVDLPSVFAVRMPRDAACASS